MKDIALFVQISIGVWSLLFNLFLWFKWQDALACWGQAKNLQWAAEAEVSELKRRLAPFKAYEDQVSR